MTWIFGIGSIYKVQVLFKRFQKSSCEEYNKNFSTQYNQFHPLMIFALSHKISETHLTKIQRCIGSNSNLNNDHINILKSVSAIDPCINLDRNDISKKNERLNFIKKKLWKYHPSIAILNKILKCQIAFLDSDNFKGISSPVFPSLILTSLYQEDWNFWRPQALAEYAHEIYHQVLFLYESADDIIEYSQRYKMIYSPIKNCKRPAIYAFHGLIAMTVMLKIFFSYFRYECTSSEERIFCHNKIVSLKSKINASYLEIANEGIKFTALGEKIKMEAFNEFKSMQIS